MRKTRHPSTGSPRHTRSIPADAALQASGTDAARAADARGAVLIRFDRKTTGLVAALMLFLALGTLMRIHGSSIGLWNRKTHDQSAEAGVLWGTPKLIRADEWYFATPMILSQAAVRPAFPAVNPSWGPA